MAEIPTTDVSHLHRSIEQLRSMHNSVYGPLGGSTDLRASLVHEYKPLHVSDLRNNNIDISDRLDYLSAAKTIIDGGRSLSIGGGDSNPEQTDMRHGVDQPDIKPYVTNNNINHNNNNNNNNNSAPSTPPTPLSIAEAQMQEAKVSEEVSPISL